MKKKILGISLFTTTSLMAMYAENAYLYKDPRIMGMGGANIAVGSYSSAVFTNPAGLINIKKSDGFVVDIFNIGASGSTNTKSFVNDLITTEDIDDDNERTKAEVDLAKKYSGEHFHTDTTSYLALAKNSENFAWSIGVLSAQDSNIMLHANTPKIAEVNARGYANVIAGIAKEYNTEIGNLNVGMSFQYMKGKSYEGILGISELRDDDNDNQSVGDKLRARYENEYSAFGVNLGAIYKSSFKIKNHDLHPSFGLSVLNIGSMDLDGEYGHQPLTVNLGVAIQPKIKYINEFTLAADYVDLFNANKLRIYNYREKVDYTDYDTSAGIKHFNLGMRMNFVDNKWFETTLMTGLYQGSYTAGLDMRLLVFRLNLATYEEQVGDTTTTISDRRYMVKLGISW
ncbi:hypothetical protein MNB_SM-3-386 [hydrothermal vent metagenome]|uniref:Uncharacterized protein n=1 Tax=hydrothermal vent metagenome TaxID=652676 RepID=A0A1W1D4M7_9ZZZZ